MVEKYFGQKPYKKILLFSGGVDSVVAYAMLQPDHCFYFNLGTKYSDAELNAIGKMGITKLSIVNTLKLVDYEETNANIPMRNMYLLMGAVNEAIRWWPYEKGFSTFLTVQKDEMSTPDRNQHFFIAAQELVSKLTYKVIRAGLPFQYTDKTEMVNWYLDNFNNAKEMLLKSYSCFKGDEVECGNCPACFRKWVSFINNNIVENEWQINPATSDIAYTYKNNIHKYSAVRQKRIVSAFNNVGIKV